MVFDVIIVGGGLVSSLTACYLQRLNLNCAVFEKRSDLRKAGAEAGRSINLILTSRGLNALHCLNLPHVRAEVLAITVPVEGRQMHNIDGTETYQPYGISATEVNYSINRSELNCYLMTLAESLGAVFFFQHSLLSVDFSRRSCVFQGTTKEMTCTKIILGADGVGSLTRTLLLKQVAADGDPEPEFEMQRLGVSYKEVHFPAKPGTNEYALNGRRLHIWPRGSHFLMALADSDARGTFTGTLYLPDTPDAIPSFDSVGKNTGTVAEYFTTQFPDITPNTIPNYQKDYATNAHSFLASVKLGQWSYKDRCLIIGDASHGIVPFLGQGMNSGLEDCVLLSRLIVQHGTNKWETVFEEFSKFAHPAATAIRQMAIENYSEMASKVGDVKWLARKALETKIETAMPLAYRSRYYMITNTLIPFDWVYRCGEINNEILDELLEIGEGHAARLVEAKLAPYLKEKGIVLSQQRKMYYPGAELSYGKAKL